MYVAAENQLLFIELENKLLYESKRETIFEIADKKTKYIKALESFEIHTFPMLRVTNESILPNEARYGLKGDKNLTS